MQTKEILYSTLNYFPFLIRSIIISVFCASIQKVILSKSQLRRATTTADKVANKSDQKLSLRPKGKNWIWMAVNWVRYLDHAKRKEDKKESIAIDPFTTNL